MRLVLELYQGVRGLILEWQLSRMCKVPVLAQSFLLLFYRIASAAGANGTARIRVLYATDVDAPARPTGPYRIPFGGESWQVQVPDADVRSGRTLAIAPTAR